MGEKLCIGELPEARAIVGHGVGRPWDVIVAREIPMKTLVDGLEAEEVGSWATGGGGAFALPKYGGGVVVEVMDGALPDIGQMGKDIVLGNGASQLEITVGDGAVRVAIRLEGAVRVGAEPLPPQEGSVGGSGVGRGEEKHTAHAGPGCIACANGGRGGGNGFGNASGPSSQFGGQPPEVVEEVMDGGAQA
jgi:hypothetical protein